MLPAPYCHRPIGLLDGHEEGGDFGFAVGTGGLSKQGHQPGSRGHQDPGETGGSLDGGAARPPETDTQNPGMPLGFHREGKAHHRHQDRFSQGRPRGGDQEFQVP